MTRNRNWNNRRDDRQPDRSDNSSQSQRQSQPQRPQQPQQRRDGGSGHQSSSKPNPLPGVSGNQNPEAPYAFKGRARVPQEVIQEIDDWELASGVIQDDEERPNRNPYSNIQKRGDHYIEKGSGQQRMDDSNDGDRIARQERNKLIGIANPPENMQLLPAKTGKPNHHNTNTNNGQAPRPPKQQQPQHQSNGQPNNRNDRPDNRNAGNGNSNGLPALTQSYFNRIRLLGRFKVIRSNPYQDEEETLTYLREVLDGLAHEVDPQSTDKQVRQNRMYALEQIFPTIVGGLLDFRSFEEVCTITGWIQTVLEWWWNSDEFKALNNTNHFKQCIQSWMTMLHLYAEWHSGVTGEPLNDELTIPGVIYALTSSYGQILYPVEQRDL